MFRNGQTIYCKNEIVAKKLREIAKKLNAETPDAPEYPLDPMAPLPNPTAYTNPYIKLPDPDLSVGAVNVFKMPKLPAFLLDVMNGGTFPAPEDLTRAEQAILYDNQINKLVNLYRQTKKADLAQHIRERLDELGVDF